jgi:hypothetical protein
MPKLSEVPWGTVIAGLVAVYGAALSTVNFPGQRRRDRRTAQAERPRLEIVIENQNFAYSIMSAARHLTPPDQAVVRFRFRNYGKTAALFNGVKANIVHSTEMPEDITYIEWQDFSQNHIVQSTHISDRGFQVEFPAPFDDNVVSGVTTGKSFLWFCGLAAYKDLYQHEYFTRFCFRYSHRDQSFTPFGGKPYNEST